MLRISARQRRRLIRLGSVLVLAFAVAPQVMYLGHPLSEEQVATAAQAAPPGHEHHAQAKAEHAGHCHVDAKGCGAGSAPINVASFGEEFNAPGGDGAFTAVPQAPLPRGFALWQRLGKPPQAA